MNAMDEELVKITKSVIKEDVEKRLPPELRHRRNKRLAIGAGVTAGVGAAGVGATAYGLGRAYSQFKPYEPKTPKGTSGLSRATTATGNVARRTGSSVANIGRTTRAGIGDLKTLIDEIYTIAPHYNEAYKKLDKPGKQRFIDNFRINYKTHLNAFINDPEHREKTRQTIEEFKQNKKNLKPKSLPPSSKTVTDLTGKSKSLFRRAAGFIIRRGK